MGCVSITPFSPRFSRLFWLSSYLLVAFVVLSRLSLDALRLLYTFSPLLAYSILLLLGQGFAWRKKLGGSIARPYLIFSLFIFLKSRPLLEGLNASTWLQNIQGSLLLCFLRLRYLFRSGSVLRLLFISVPPAGFLIYREKFIPITHLPSNSKISFQIYIHG